MHDALGHRMKENYEYRTQSSLPRRTNTIIRLDGKAFHTYTRGLEKPFDNDFMDDMVTTTKLLCTEIQGCKLGYVQSDEISLLLTDYDSEKTEAWFDSNVQKIVSVSASMATAFFNYNRKTITNNLAFFDSRVFVIPDKIEVANYFLWRMNDAVRNSIQSLAQSLYSHKKLYNKNLNELQEMCFQAGQNWNDLPVNKKQGTIVFKHTKKNDIKYLKWDVATYNPRTFNEWFCFIDCLTTFEENKS